MKELKVILATPHPKMKNACDVAIEVYLKSEVDPVIAELNGQVNGFKNRANLWEYNAQNEHNGAVTVRMENAKLKAKLAEKDKKIAELKEQYKDMDVTHTVHIAKMNAKIEELEELEESHKKEVEQLLMKIAGLEKLVETADKFIKQKGGFTVKDIMFDGVKLEGMKND